MQDIAVLKYAAALVLICGSPAQRPAHIKDERQWRIQSRYNTAGYPLSADYADLSLDGKIAPPPNNRLTRLSNDEFAVVSPTMSPTASAKRYLYQFQQRLITADDIAATALSR